MNDVIISIYRLDGTRVTTARGDEKSLRLWRSRWVRQGFIARQIDERGNVREYGMDN